jgi:hypothetical protein
MRSFLVKGIFGEAPESDVEPLGQLAGSLEQLVLSPFYYTLAALGMSCCASPSPSSPSQSCGASS